MRRILCLSLMAAAVASVSAADDAEAIRQAVLNYANSAYEVRPDLVVESVHPSLHKIGYVSRDGAPYRQLWMNYYQLQELVAGWNKEGRFDPATAKREVKILDQLDQTAVARLDAEWGIDFFHLAKQEDGWKIMNVIWQTYPPETPLKAACSDNSECGDSQYCMTGPGACDAAGRCEPRTEMCTMDYRPVCGCDGQTYSNACAASTAGVSVAADGSCE